jgi:exodeoxyribonuclease VII large subunit
MGRSEPIRKVYSVTQINRYVKHLLTQDGILSGIWMRGELSNYKAHSSGHRYFTIKDEEGAISAVMFASYAGGLTFVPREGQQVEVQGSVSLYEKTGQYQFYVTKMEPQGRGALYQAYEELKQKLDQQGLFDVSAKKEIPPFPRKVGIVTSPTGAALQDMIRVAKRRHPGVSLVLCPCLVQGEEAAEDIVRSLRRLDREPDVDVILVGRGGGSMEDLWAFNEEIVARAIYAAKTPIISAVGHETDFTIADFVADLRAATPSAAAELAVPDTRVFFQTIRQNKDRMARAADRKQQVLRRQLQTGKNRLWVQRPTVKVRDLTVRVDQQREALQRGKQQYFDTVRQRVNRLQWQIDSLNPWTQLQKGYALVLDACGRPISTVAQRYAEESLRILVKDGQIKARVEAIEQKEVEQHGEKDG